MLFLDEKNFRSFFDEYYNLTCNFVNSFTNDWDLAQEIAQKVFIRIWEKRSEIEIYSEKNYLFKVAYNTLVDHYRQKKIRNQHNETYDKLSHALSQEKVESHAEKVRQKELIARAIQQLKPKTRKIFLLNKKEGLTYKEIAKHLNIPKRTVEYNMKVAAIRLREILKHTLFDQNQ